MDTQEAMNPSRLPVKTGHLTICICTFRRPELLKRTLDSLRSQTGLGTITYSIVVSDNDREGSGRSVVEESAAESSVPIKYVIEPRQNIALARNRALAASEGEFIAFIDDDEFACDDWLSNMLNVCRSYNAAGVLGPVRPHFAEAPPQWIIDGGFCERPEHPTGRIMDWEECRTGNVLFRALVLEDEAQAFLPEFGTGGEDKDFFQRMGKRSHIFRWCNEGAVYETVPPERWRRRYMLKRAMLRGKNILKHPEGRMALIAKSLVAAPAYALVIPPSFVMGQHVFMKYCIRFCDHFGRLLAAVGLNRVNER